MFTACCENTFYPTCHPRTGSSGGTAEYKNKHFGSIKDGKFFISGKSIRFKKVCSMQT
jgi:hypothetical protein